MRIPVLISALVLALSISLSARAEDAAIGYVKNVSGEASVSSGGQMLKAAVGTPIQIGSVLRTGPKSSMGVTFKDETVMSFGPDTELTVDEYLYAPAQGKLKPDAVSVDTPSGTIGIRGTQFVVKVEKED